MESPPYSSMNPFQNQGAEAVPYDGPPPAYTSCSGSSTSSNEIVRKPSIDFPSLSDNPGEDSYENQRYIEYIERMKQVLFPGSLDFAKLSPRLRFCVAYVEDELFELQKEKNHILRRQGQLIYMLQDAVLEDDCARLREEVNQLAQIPDEKKSPKQLKREEKLVEEIVSIVHKRNTILEDMHIERMRENEEDEEMNRVYSRHKKELANFLASSSSGGVNGRKSSNGDKFGPFRMKNRMNDVNKGCIML